VSAGRRSGRTGLSPRHAAILTLLCDAGETLSTTEVRERITRGRERALVAEQVYRALISLQRAGGVRRVHVAGSRKAFWEATVDVVREKVS
jgi:Fe2+ or Zn2+ uptake regulation protein